MGSLIETYTLSGKVKKLLYGLLRQRKYGVRALREACLTMTSEVFVPSDGIDKDDVARNWILKETSARVAWCAWSERDFGSFLAEKRVGP